MPSGGISKWVTGPDRHGSQHAEPHAVAREGAGRKGLPGKTGAVYVENHMLVSTRSGFSVSPRISASP